MTLLSYFKCAKCYSVLLLKTKQNKKMRGGERGTQQQQQKIQPTTSELHIGFESREMDFCFH